ncbi:hypothetical protein [Dietzia sp. CH92]|uniref:hypothetical protein n=1 Tax=Dietzia sp. CH92 TaxID=3051823 RepID=UPI0028D52438|nr:hypothetical protein [Dietzia sp. CH92]
MTGTNGPGRPGDDPDFRPDAEVEGTPRRSRQPALTVLAIVAILLLVLAVGIFGGIF